MKISPSVKSVFYFWCILLYKWYNQTRVKLKLKMLEQKQPYCLMPWIHYHVTNNGKVNACCVANIPFGNVNEQIFEEIWNEKPINELRHKFLNGEKDKRCAVCYKLEETGGKSIRQETFEKFGHVELDFEHPKLPFYFDIRFSNACNFRCRTCWHGASSGWFADAKALGRNISDQAVLKNIDDFDSFVQQTGKALLQAKEIYFAGGEPLVTEAHYRLLDFLLAHNKTDIKLRYNTNFSVLNLKKQSIIDYWAKFSSVEVLASVDAAGKLGEYIRKGFDWQRFCSNRDAIRILPHVQFKLAPTISVFNVRHMPVFYALAVAQNIVEPDDFYTNILHRPSFYNIQCLPVSCKEVIRLEYEIFIERKLPTEVARMFQEIIDFMFAAHRPKDWKAFWKETESLDLLRQETLSDVEELAFLQET